MTIMTHERVAHHQVIHALRRAGGAQKSVAREIAEAQRLEGIHAAAGGVRGGHSARDDTNEGGRLSFMKDFTDGGHCDATPGARRTLGVERCGGARGGGGGHGSQPRAPAAHLRRSTHILMLHSKRYRNCSTTGS